MSWMINGSAFPMVFSFQIAIRRVMKVGEAFLLRYD